MQKKILFVNPPTNNLVSSGTPLFVETERGFNPPLGLIQIATCVNQNTKHEAKVLDTQVLEMDFNKTKAEIKKIDPDVVGISVNTFTLSDSFYIAKIVKETNPSIKVVMGGPHITLFPNETIKQKDVDMVIVGEGEITFQETIDVIQDPKKLKKINGLLFKDKKGKIIITPPRKFIKNLDEIPIPDRTLIPYKKYSSVLAKKNPLTTMITSRGCPYRCTFCDRPQMGGKTWRAKSPKVVVDEIEQIKDLGINEILFYDDTWTIDMKRAEKICKKILARNLDITWDTRTRPDLVTSNLVKLMKRAGCRRINFGVESGTEKGLVMIKKDITLDGVEKAFKICKEVYIDSLAYFMFGLPGETKKEMIETIHFAKKIKPNFCHFSIFTPFPETKIWRDLIHKGDTSLAESWKKYAENPTTTFNPPTCNKYMNKKQLFEMCHYAYKSFYFRPEYIVKELIRVRSIKEFARKTRAGIKILIPSKMI